MAKKNPELTTDIIAAYIKEDRKRVESGEISAQTLPNHTKPIKVLLDSNRVPIHWKSYLQRSKAETIFSVIKRMVGEYVISRHIKTQNREVMYRVMADNCYRITNTRNYLVILDWFLQGH